MVIIKNCFVLAKYFINSWWLKIKLIEDANDKKDNADIDCNCNLCYTVSKIIRFFTCRLRIISEKE